MITPSQIREKKISTVESGGYDRDEVNNLLLEIIESYEAVFNENKELYRKMEVLANRIEEYRADEDSIKSALITAEKMASKLTNEAKQKAEETLSDSAKSAQQTVVDAKAKADKIIGEAREYVAGLTKEKAAAADEIINEAREKANAAIDGANVVANNTLVNAKKLATEIVSKAKAEKDYHSEIVEKLKNESKDFRTTLVSLYETQLEKIKDLAKIGEDFTADTEDIDTIEDELNRLLDQIDDSTVESEEKQETEQETVEEKTEETVVEEEENGHDDQVDADETEEASKDDGEAEEDKSEETETDDGELELEEIDSGIDEVDEIIDQLESMDTSAYEPVEEEDNQPPTHEEVENAINSFSTDEITPIDDSVKSIPVIDDEPEFESAMPFESFFDTSKGHQGTDEAISLIPPDDDEEESNSKFKGFFKKKK